MASDLNFELLCPPLAGVQGVESGVLKHPNI